MKRLPGSQCLKLIEHFQRGQPLTAQEAQSLYNIARLASRIHELKQLGYTIATDLVPMKRTRIASYRFA